MISEVSAFCFLCCGTVRSPVAETSCKPLWSDSHPLSSSSLPERRSLAWHFYNTSSSFFCWKLAPQASGLSSHTLSQWKESLVALFFKIRVPECFDCVEFDFFVGSHQPKEGRCLWCAKKSTCKCKYISSLLLDPHNLALYRGLVCNPRKGVHNSLLWIQITTCMALLGKVCWGLLSGSGEGG